MMRKTTNEDTLEINRKLPSNLPGIHDSEVSSESGSVASQQQNSGRHLVPHIIPQIESNPQVTSHIPSQPRHNESHTTSAVDSVYSNTRSDVASNVDSMAERLLNAINQGQVASKKDRTQYLPLDTFEQLFTKESIEKLIAETFPASTNTEKQERVANVIGKDGKGCRRRILAILVVLEKAFLIDEFIRQNMTDDNCELPPRNIDWRYKDEVAFFYFYWHIFVPFFHFSGDTLNFQKLRPEDRLPFQVYGCRTEGGNGMVYQVQFHPAHHNYESTQGADENPYFALKQVNQQTYPKELEAYEKIYPTLQKEKHLIKPLLTFTQRENCFFLFEWADGNVRQLWDKGVVTQPQSPVARYWAATQLLGIATAIRRIHGLLTWQKENRQSFGVASTHYRSSNYGRHGDIKPENILWFQARDNDHNLLVVSDLGLTRYSSDLTKSLVSEVEGLTRSYRPPEIDLGQNISPRYDVWSLGCFFLEFLIWYIEGVEELEKFEIERQDEDFSDILDYKEPKYFNIDKENRRPSVKNTVQKRIRKLRGLKIGPTCLTNLLDVIEFRMLIVDPRTRGQIDKICEDIRDLQTSLKIEHHLEQFSDFSQVLQFKNNVDKEIDVEMKYAQGGETDIIIERKQSLSIHSEDESDSTPSENGKYTQTRYSENYLSPRLMKRKRSSEHGSRPSLAALDGIRGGSIVLPERVLLTTPSPSIQSSSSQDIQPSPSESATSATTLSTESPLEPPQDKTMVIYSNQKTNGSGNLQTVGTIIGKKDYKVEEWPAKSSSINISRRTW